MSEALIAAIIAAIASVGGAVLGAFIGGMFARRKSNADATKVLTDAASQLTKTAVDNLITPLSERIDGLDRETRDQALEIGRLKRMLAQYASRVVYLMGGIETLIKQIKAKDETPCWTPDEWTPGKGGGGHAD
jgi:hypothetical protein